VKKHPQNFTVNTAYTEPLGKKNGFATVHQINNNSGNSNFITYDFR
jgi:hypothetical protein